MRQKIIFILVFWIIFLFIAHSVFSYEKLNNDDQRKVWSVDDEGDGDFKTIKKALRNAKNGDTIRVYSGIYC